MPTALPEQCEETVMRLYVTVESFRQRHCHFIRCQELQRLTSEVPICLT